MSTYYDQKYFDYQKQIGMFGGIANRFKFAEHIKPTDVVLDFGCGGGYLLKNLDCREKWGVEINPVARAEALKSGIQVVEDAASLPDHHMDVVISNHALEHVRHPLECLMALKSKLKPGGRLIFVVPHHRADEPWDAADVNHHLFSWNPMTLGNLFVEAGYSVEKVDGLLHKWPPHFLEIYQKLGEAEFHRQCRQHAKETQQYQIKIVATAPSELAPVRLTSAESGIAGMVRDFSSNTLIDPLREFLGVYHRRAVQQDQEPNQSGNLFCLWYLLNRLKPGHVIESGVWKGNITWLIEETLPEVPLDCLDVSFEHLQYRSKKATYSTTDFLERDWVGLDKSNALVIFDDHQDALIRLESAKRQGFRYLIFADNYPKYRGAHLSLQSAKEGYDNTISKDGRFPNEVVHQHLIHRFQRLGIKTYWMIPNLFVAKSDYFKNCGEIPQTPVFDTIPAGLEKYAADSGSYRWMTFVEL